MQILNKMIKKYYLFSLIISCVIVILLVGDGIRNGSVLHVDIFYCMRVLLVTLIMSFICTPIVAFLDLCIVQASRSLYKDFKYADRTGKITIIVVIIIQLLRKLYFWNK